MIDVDVAVIGGGFSGCAVTAQLARLAPPGFSLALFEPGELGRGAAYGTPHGEHILNTRAHAMSLFPEEPGHFVQWLGGRAAPGDFVSRRLYGEYVAGVTRRAFERPAFSVVRDRVRGVRRVEDRNFVVESARGGSVCARAVVLATGNPLPADQFLPREVLMHPGYVADPWRFDYRAVGGHVLVIGSGLTALDALVALDASRHRGTVHMLSRHARLPEVHADVPPSDVIPAIDTRSARAALRSLRRHVDEARSRGYDWRSVFDALRPESEFIWRRFAESERARFERHLRAHWERHRHRAPQAVDAVRRRYEATGRLRRYAGRLVGLRGGAATIALRGEMVTLHPDWIVNCAGVGRTTALPGGSPPAGEGVWAVGPAARGSRFEATAVPEVRLMAQQAAAEILVAARREAQPA